MRAEISRPGVPGRSGGQGGTSQAGTTCLLVSLGARVESRDIPYLYSAEVPRYLIQVRVHTELQLTKVTTSYYGTYLTTVPREGEERGRVEKGKKTAEEKREKGERIKEKEGEKGKEWEE